MDFRILGPLEVADNGREPVIAPGKQRALLAMLLLHANEVVSSDRLIEELWGEQPPASAAKSLQVHISRLRRALEGERGNGADSVVVTRGGGYLVRVGPGELDLERFEHLLDEGSVALAEGDPERALELLREALGLWRGAPLAEFAYEEFAQDEIARLEELHLAALEQRIEAQLALGRHSQVIGELETLVKHHPFRERLHAQLMLALYRSGRQTEALDAYQQARRTLVDEVGVEPGEQLRGLERAVLAHDPALSAPPTAAPPGREEEPPRAQPPRRGRRALGVSVALFVAVALIGTVMLITQRADEPHAAALTDDSHAVAVIDPASNEVKAAVPVGVNPGPLAFEPRTRSLWVGNIDDRSVTRIDLHPLRASRTLPVGKPPADLAAGEGAVWVAAAPRTERSVTARRVDARFNTVGPPIRVKSLRGTGGSSSLVLANGDLWVAPSFGRLRRVDPQTRRVEASIATRHTPSAVAAGEGAIWIADYEAAVVTRVEPRSGALREIQVPGGPGDITIGAGSAWVSLPDDDALARIDTADGAVSDTIEVGRRPAGVAVGAGAVWVANSGDGTVSRIDPKTARVTDTIEVGAGPQDVVVADGRVWVSVRQRPAAAPSETIRVDEPEDVDFLDPALAYVVPSLQFLYPTCANLLRYPDSAGPEGPSLQPELAAAVPRPTDGGRTYTFRIRRGFRFSPPSGEAVTPQAVKSSVERTMHPRMGSPGAAYLADLVGASAYAAGNARHIRGITATRDTVKFRLVSASSDFLDRISLPFFCVLPVGTPVDPEGLRSLPAAGPYYVSSQLTGEQIVLSRNPNYEGPRRRRPAEVRITVGSQEDQAIARAEANRVDYVPSIGAASSARRLQRLYGPRSAATKADGQRYFVHTRLQVDYLAFNTSRPPFSSARLRRAVNYALDRRLLARTGYIYPVPAAPTDQYLPPGIRGFRDVEIYPMTPDLARARRLAGSKRRTVVLYTEGRGSPVRSAEIVQANLRAIGIDVQIKKIGNPYERVGRRGEPFDMALSSWYADFPDPINFLSLLDGRNIVPELNVNIAYFDEPAYNRKLDAAAKLPPGERELALGRLDAQVARTAAPWAAIANERTHDFFSDRVGCQVFNPVFGLDLGSLCIKAK